MRWLLALLLVLQAVSALEANASIVNLPPQITAIATNFGSYVYPGSVVRIDVLVRDGNGLADISCKPEECNLTCWSSSDLVFDNQPSYNKQSGIVSYEIAFTPQAQLAEWNCAIFVRDNAGATDRKVFSIEVVSRLQAVVFRFIKIAFYLILFIVLTLIIRKLMQREDTRYTLSTLWARYGKLREGIIEADTYLWAAQPLVATSSNQTAKRGLQAARSACDSGRFDDAIALAIRACKLIDIELIPEIPKRMLTVSEFLLLLKLLFR